MWFGGWIGLSVALKRTGGGLVAGTYWLLVGWLIRHGELPQPGDHRLQAASAA
jgi:hypothetical protein